jgi:hypothetical protein
MTAARLGKTSCYRRKHAPRFLSKSPNHNIRNGIGVRDDHTVVFAISSDPVTFAELAQLFRERLQCPNALYLDGAVSSLYAPFVGRAEFSEMLGPMLRARLKPELLRSHLLRYRVDQLEAVDAARYVEDLLDDLVASMGAMQAAAHQLHAVRWDASTWS